MKLNKKEKLWLWIAVIPGAYITHALGTKLGWDSGLISSIQIPLLIIQILGAGFYFTHTYKTFKNRR
jgi:hypothetical protein